MQHYSRLIPDRPFAAALRFPQFRGNDDSIASPQPFLFSDPLAKITTLESIISRLENEVTLATNSLIFERMNSTRLREEIALLQLQNSAQQQQLYLQKQQLQLELQQPQQQLQQTQHIEQPSDQHQSTKIHDTDPSKTNIKRLNWKTKPDFASNSDLNTQYNEFQSHCEAKFEREHYSTIFRHESPIALEKDAQECIGNQESIKPDVVEKNDEQLTQSQALKDQQALDQKPRMYEFENHPDCSMDGAQADGDDASKNEYLNQFEEKKEQKEKGEKNEGRSDIFTKLSMDVDGGDDGIEVDKEIRQKDVANNVSCLSAERTVLVLEVATESESDFSETEGDLPTREN
ncbi:UNVERIFIED_CONTAM: hypothetical protein HDU68_007494 [Siphonaria sp. JEL0065]|nr:hypothetical protein HDU68_007494 [Siphonaria sp. JEL0065]